LPFFLIIVPGRDCCCNASGSEPSTPGTRFIITKTEHCANLMCAA
jgi:hypothetical protein